MDILDLPNESWTRTAEQGAADAARDAVCGFYREMRAKCMEPLLALMTDDIEISLPFSESGRVEAGQFRVFNGKAEVRRFFDSVFALEKESRGLGDAEVTVSADGQRVFVEGFGNLTMANGRPYNNRYVFRFDLVHGRIRELREYYNPIVAARAFGRSIAGEFNDEASCI